MCSNKICTDSRMTILATNLAYFTSEILHIELKVKILQVIRFFTKHAHNTNLLIKYSLQESC